MLLWVRNRFAAAEIVLLCLVLAGCAGQKSSQPTTTPQETASESPESSGSESESTQAPTGQGEPGGSGEPAAEVDATGTDGEAQVAPSESASAQVAGGPGSTGPPTGNEPGGRSGEEPAAAGAPGTTGVLTTDERRAGLDRELDESLKQFDELLAAEEEDLSERRAQTEAQIAASGGGSSPMGSGDAGASAGGQATGDSPTGGPGGHPAGAKGGGGGAAPADIKDGSDDDVVARQLREAAENEKDPELREKLWQEYRDYKAGVSGKKKPESQDGESKTDGEPSSDKGKDAGDEKKQE